MFDNWLILNPKQSSKSKLGRTNWYSYYAGFSVDFVQSILRASKLPSTAKILDPWNGSGTTTAVAVDLGYHAIGYDLNPVMVVACKARLLGPHQRPSLWPITVDIITKVASIKNYNVNDCDPLCTWLEPNSAACLRQLERATHKLLVDEKCRTLDKPFNVDEISDLAAFYYIGLFRTLRTTIQKFIPSNPTWMKRPKQPSDRLSLSEKVIIDTFKREVQAMIASTQDESIEESNKIDQFSVSVASSTELPIQNNFVNIVLSSPPYCTRIDYAVATMPELALLGYDLTSSFNRLRRNLIGTSTVPDTVANPPPEWGETCNNFLANVAKHHSKASKTYYYKNHVQYFDGIYRSMSEISRVLKDGGLCFLVVQDSYYKDIHNDLSKTFTEMAHNCSLALGRRFDFLQRRSMVGINPEVRKYRSRPSSIESVLCLYRK